MQLPIIHNSIIPSFIWRRRNAMQRNTDFFSSKWRNTDFFIILIIKKIWTFYQVDKKKLNFYLQANQCTDFIFYQMIKKNWTFYQRDKKQSAKKKSVDETVCYFSTSKNHLRSNFQASEDVTVLFR